MKYISFGLPAIIVIFAVSVLTLTGCRENTVINSKIAPSNNPVNVLSWSLPCITHTYYDDTAVTSTNIGGLPAYQAVGSFIDPFFGVMTGTTFFQVIASDPVATLYDGQTIDSAILVLPYSGFTYGDTTDQSLTQSYQVFYLLDSLGSSINSTYFSYSTKPVDALTPLSDPTTVNIYHLRDSFGVNMLSVNHSGLRIKLRLSALLNHLLPAQQIFSSTTVTPAADFIGAFKGLCVRVSDSRNSNNAIPYFQLDGGDPYSEAGILVYYHTTGSTVASDTFESYYFNTSYCAHFNNVNKSFTRYPVDYLFHSTQANDSIVALQNQPGASMDIVIPGITKIPAGIITKAELQLTLLPGHGNYLSSTGGQILLAPERLYPVGVGNGAYPSGIGYGLTYTIADLYRITSATMSTVVDGYIHSFQRNGTTVETFTIDLPREVMTSIASKNDTLHLHIGGTQDFYGAFHMVAGGGSYPDTLYRPKLFVVYSKL